MLVSQSCDESNNNSFLECLLEFLDRLDECLLEFLDRLDECLFEFLDRLDECLLEFLDRLECLLEVNKCRILLMT